MSLFDVKFNDAAEKAAAALAGHPYAMVVAGDALDALAGLPDDYFATVITSPPYWGLRTYGNDEREIGKGDLNGYLDALAAVFTEVRRVLRPDGVLWLNIGDTSSGSGGSGGDYLKGGRKAGQTGYRQGDTGGLARMQWANIPERLTIRLQDGGWLLRSKIVWNKGRVRPEDPNHVRRPGVQWEPIFMLTKTRDYQFWPERLTENGDVWNVSQLPRSGGHVAAFPDELVERCLLPSTTEGDVVLDPFVGSGTTLAVANQHGRHAVGIELVEGNLNIVRSRVAHAMVVPAADLAS
jgi:site-specific DNA-methyltransferase (cytosine-N4-specific)